MGERKEINISSHEAKRQNEIIHILAQHIKGKGLKYCIATFGIFYDI